MGCIPVVLSNSWVLPFSEVIDWSSAVIIADERLLFQIPDKIRSISQFEIESMRAQCIFLYNTYFSSLERIIITTISIIEDRINSHLTRESFLWNVANKSPLSPLWIVHSYSDQIAHFPSYSRALAIDTAGFTAIVPISRVISIYQLTKFLKASLMASKYVKKILLIWTLASPVSPQIAAIASAYSSLITVVANNQTTQSGLHARFTCCLNYSSTNTDAVFQLDPESNLIPEEVTEYLPLNR